MDTEQKISEITYSIEKASEIGDEVFNIAKDHWEEVDTRDEYTKPNPDWEKYYLLESQGFHRLVTARQDGELIGYISLITAPSLHCKGEIDSQIELLYVKKEYREESIGSDLILSAENYSSDLGAERVSFSLKGKSPHNNLVSDLEYTLTEQVFTKRVRGI